MEINLVPVKTEEAELLHQMQKEAFMPLYLKYRDRETSPATESLEKTLMRLSQPFTYFYFIQADGEKVGAIRIVDERDACRRKRISPIFIMPPHRGRGYAKAAVKAAERIHGETFWELDTILQEEGNCRLYEKLGYRQTGEQRIINDRMTLVMYRK